MTINLETIQRWLTASVESEHLEFKEARTQFSKDKLLEYVVAIGNEGGGYLVLGISNNVPREIVGSAAFSNPEHLNELKLAIHTRIGVWCQIDELHLDSKRIVVFSIPSRTRGSVLHINGNYLMRAGESLVGMPPDRLRSIFAENTQPWLELQAATGVSDSDVIALLDSQTYFDLRDAQYPSGRHLVLEHFENVGLIIRDSAGWTIPNMTACLLGKRLSDFGSTVANRAPRVIIYEGNNKLNTRLEFQEEQGYAVIFARLLDQVHSLAPQNRFVEEAIRVETKMFPKQALRELIANILVHQDFDEFGRSPKIELFDDRVELSNGGIPPIDTDRFIDEDRARNERLAAMMRKLHICEQKGSGVDKVITAAELY